jgi:glycine dehydrogenase
MLETLGYASLEVLIDEAVPPDIRLRRPLAIGAGAGEHEMLEELRRLAERNEVYRSYLGMGYHDCVLPAVIQRNVLENPGWYTAYTPYQPEISQGRLEALLNFQTVVIDLTGLEIANASLLDEATAAAEAMSLCYAARGGPERRAFFVDRGCHPQTLDVVRAFPQEFEVVSLSAWNNRDTLLQQVHEFRPAMVYAAAPGRAPGGSTSRPCSPTPTTRCAP